MTRVVAWSGPRNLSTAMMYAWGARGDCAVVDEPFYAAYLAATGLEHPMRDAVLASQPVDPRAVAAACAAEGSRPLTYQKHMAHHMLPDFPLGWAEGARHVHLIRHPARVVASYAAARDGPTLADIGVVRQAALYDRFGGVVIDSADIRRDPARALRALCDALAVSYTDAMLGWPPGGRPEDGVWAAHWYGAVHASTGFAGPEGPLPRLSGAAAEVAAAAMPFYEAMAAVRLRP